MSLCDAKVAFLGNMNNFPFANALALREAGCDVDFFVDVPREILLDRPEAYMPDGRLPDWCEEVCLDDFGKRRFFRMLAPGRAYASLIRRLRAYDAVFLNGEWVRLAAYLPPAQFIVGMYAGLDVELADETRIDEFAAAMKSSKPAYRRIPFGVFRALWKRYIRQQALGLGRVHLSNYYFPGVNAAGDAVIEKLKNPQFHVRLPLRGIDQRAFVWKAHRDLNGPFHMLCPTRFFFATDRNDNKRNDLMIEGIGKFLCAAGPKPDVRITFFEKGPDVALAKHLCTEWGFDHLVEWHPIVPMAELQRFLESCHVHFDQLGEQWIGATGLYGMLIGRPVICNYRPELLDPFTGGPAPICQARSSDEVAEWLRKLYTNRGLIASMGVEANDYASRFYDLKNDVAFFDETYRQYQASQLHRPELRA